MAIPFLNHITLNQNEARDFGMHLAESGDIATPVAGQLIFDNGTGQNIMKYYDGSAWISVGADTDNYVDGASFATNTLTLTRTGTLADITVDLSSLSDTYSFDISDGSTTDTISNGDTVEFVGNNGITTFVNPTPLGPDYIRIEHDDVTRTNTTSTATGVHGAAFTVIDSITSSAQGHITAVNTKTVTLPSDNNTDTLQDISAASTDDSDYYLTSVLNATGAQTGYSHSALRFNPSTETLVTQNLIVSGTSTTVNTETINLADNIITLNSNAAGTPSENAGIEVERGDSDNVSLNWNEADDDWEFLAPNHAATPALVTYKIPRTFATTVGNGTLTDIPVTHNLGTRQVIVQLYDTSSYETVYADVVRTDDNTVTLTFASAPATGDITVLISTAGV